MLDAVAELGQHVPRNIGRVLAHEVDAHALRTDQLHQLYDLLQEGLWRVLEEQMGFVEEEHSLGFLRVAYLRETLKQL